MEDVISHVSNSRQSSFTDMAQALEGTSTPADPDRKVALITGITGQDGSYLAEFLLEKGYQVGKTKLPILFHPPNSFCLNAQSWLLMNLAETRNTESKPKLCICTCINLNC